MRFELSLTANRSVVRESLKGIVWTILFHRLFGPIVPTTNEFLEVVYPMAAYQDDLDAEIDRKVDDLLRKYLVAPTQVAPRTGVLMILFMDENQVKSKKKSGWFAHITEGKHESYVWESWIVQVECTPLTTSEHLGKGDAIFKPSVASFERNIEAITNLVDRHKDHIPPIMTLDVAPFPYKFDVLPKAPGNHKRASEDESWSNYIKKMID